MSPEERKQTWKDNQFKPGHSGNPGGRPVKARVKLQGNFMNALAEDFERYGRYALARCRRKDPAAYIRCVVQLMPKELEISRPLGDMSDDELASVLETVRALELAQRAGTGSLTAPRLESPEGLQAVSEAG